MNKPKAAARTDKIPKAKKTGLTVRTNVRAGRIATNRCELLRNCYSQEDAAPIADEHGGVRRAGQRPVITRGDVIMNKPKTSAKMKKSPKAKAKSLKVKSSVKGGSIVYQ
jgi:hypothetical protein